MVGTVVKAKIGELEEEVWSGYLISMRKDFTVVVQGISWKKSFLVRFQNGCKHYMSSNQLTIVILEKSLVEKEPELPMDDRTCK